MDAAVEVEVAGRGQITIPEQVRHELGIEDGQRYAVRTLDGGIIVLTPKPGRASAALSRAREVLVREGASIEGLQAELRRLREADGG